MKIELTRFKIKKDKTERVNEWMQYIRDNIDAAVETLADEKMNVEFVFRESDSENEYLYWSDCRGEGGTYARDSQKEIDKKHVAFMDECVDRGAPDWKKKMNLEFVLIPDHIRRIMWP